MDIGALNHDRERRRFVLEVDGREAFIDYLYNDGEYRLVHSEVPPALRGRGVGKELVERTFAAIEAEGGRSVAICTYIRLIARRSPKWRDIVAH
jgi:predicted GNAT family acetyltransferase